MASSIDEFLNGQAFAVAGASANREKYGNKVLRAYLQHDCKVFPINPRADVIEGIQAYPALRDLPEDIHGVSYITPPPVTLQILKEAAELGIQHAWLQPGAESDEAVQFANSVGMNLISGGPCIIVQLRYKES